MNPPASAEMARRHTAAPPAMKRARRFQMAVASQSPLGLAAVAAEKSRATKMEAAARPSSRLQVHGKPERAATTAGWKRRVVHHNAPDPAANSESPARMAIGLASPATLSAKNRTD